MILKESPDYLDATINGVTYDLSLEKQYNPVTFLHIHKSDFFKNPDDPWEQRITDDFGVITIYAPTIVPGYLNFHAKIYDHFVNEEGSLNELKQKYGIDVYVHDDKKRALFEQYKQKFPNLTLIPLSIMNPQYGGRVWTVPNAAVFAMWEFRKDSIAGTTVPFLKFLYPGTNLYFQRAEGEPVQPIKELNNVQELAPYEKELAGWLAQLHIASGDEARKSEIKSEIERIIKKHNLDPKKYGLGVDITKPSQHTQQKQLGKSKLSMAELKSKERASESSIITFRDYYLQEKSIHDPVRPGILKRQVKGKMTCSKARSLKSKQKNKGNNTAKAAQRFCNYHC